jgi:hypothetical protein
MTISARPILNAAAGIAIASLLFLVAVFALAALAEKSDTSVIKQKIAEAYRKSQIQYPGKWDIDDKRGNDTFTDCLALDVSVLYRQQLPMDTFDSRVYLFPVAAPNEPMHHACNELHYVSSHPELQNSFKERSYLRYWWGSAVVARIALGLTGIAVGCYRQLIHFLSFAALGIFVLAFFYSFGRAAAVFIPLFLSILLGFGMLTFGQSIAHAPEFIVGVLMLSAYSLARVRDRSRLTRALCYSFLGSVCVYFDLLNGNVGAIEILLCCQLFAPYVSQLLKGQDQAAPPAQVVKEIIENSAYVLIGGMASVAIRIVGYSFASHTSIVSATSEWLADFAHRVSGNLNDMFPEQNVPPSLRRLIAALKGKRHLPFHGFLPIRLADAYYALGFVCWAAIFPLLPGASKKTGAILRCCLGLPFNGRCGSRVVSSAGAAHYHSCLDDRTFDELVFWVRDVAGPAIEISPLSQARLPFAVDYF